MADKVLRVFIVDDKMTRMNATLRDSARKEVENGLKSVTDTSADKTVNAGFTVEWKTSGLSSGEYSALKPTDFVVYLRGSNDAADAMKLLSQHMTIEKGHEERVHASITTQFKSEGGAAVIQKDKGVAFVVTEQFESMMFRGPFSDEEIAAQNEHVGREMAKLILHELGHLMGHDKHDNGLMAASVVVTTVADSYTKLEFSSKSKKVIREWLEKRVNAGASK